jgi:acyl transferase domain-containing protein/acyl carrier protein/enoyl-CoA hydratase/carnithine racemase/NAD(P)-dependent dehydrogenase (short-subunit alcohol dehydrogenase family)
MATDGTREPVAIIGVGMRLPGADRLDDFWQHLAAERCLISEVPTERWDAKDLMGDPARGNKTNSIWGGFIEKADCFDAAFFGISPREAAWMDPQQRFALEMAWHAIENAGYRASDLAGSRTGVYMGVCHWDYAELLEKHLANVDAYTPTGIAFSIIANRVSHFFDFQGPSITNDTACAASMTSVYEAVRALQDGTCDLALAGGVNLIWSPNHFVAFSKAGMLSKEGRSKAFDDAADGYVRGEGGAILLLKPLSKALADRDPIHAVIRGIGINHGGRTNSLTVTNPAAQAELIRQVHREAGVSPETIDYVEAHGPGTPLGDPIEISGLKQAFSALADENNVVLDPGTCGIGSVKTNIGHLEGAAGVAGIVKVLAALRHERLPANFGFKETNRLIDLSGSPFRIQKETTDWPRREAHPRRACVSSFGFGGSNAHVLLEEAPLPVATLKPAKAPLVAVPLSAASAGQLSQYAVELLRFLEQCDPDTISAVDIARTFQVAREPMEARCVFLADDLAGLTDLLRRYLIGAETEGCVLPAEMAGSEDTKAGGPVDLARRWAAGEPVDWPGADAKQPGDRIHAPVYPFERQRHWMDLSLGAKDLEPAPHPLLHRNTSGFDRSSFETRLTGDEFALADHHVDGRKVLPGVACLEMARAAADLAGGLQAPAFAIGNVVWSRPILVGDRQAVTVETALERGESSEIRFTIGTTGDRFEESDDRKALVPNASGILQPLTLSRPEQADLEALKSRSTGTLESQICYDWLRASGVDHGPAFRALSKVMRLGGGEVLAQIRLPRRLLPSLEFMPLHPVLLDAAIQAWVATGSEAPAGAAVPFACGTIEVHGQCETQMWAHVRLKSGQAANAPVRKLDIDLLDKNGERRIVIRDLALRVLKHAATDQGASETTGPLVIADLRWQATPLRLRQKKGEDRVRVLTVCSQADTEALAEKVDWQVETLPDVSDLEDAKAAETLFGFLHKLVREALEQRPLLPVNFLVLTEGTLPATVTAPLAALLKTAAIENPKISGRVVSVEGATTPDRLRAIVSAEIDADDSLVQLRYDAGGIRRTWGPVLKAARSARQRFALDPDGVYWVTGGLGGLGRLFAEWLVSKGARKLVLTGRRKRTDRDTKAWMKELGETGAQAIYRPCDLAKTADAEALAEKIQKELGPLKGVIHAAGVLDDGYILTQDPKRAAGVFAPKLAGTVNLDLATKDAPLDFLVFCSSIASVFGTAGQAVYSGANAFLDAFAEERAAEVTAGNRQGRTVAVAWPLWAEGGMSADAATIESLRRRLGLTPLPRDAGLAALEAILSRKGAPCCTVLHGDLERIGEVLLEVGQTSPVKTNQAQPSPAPSASASASVSGTTSGTAGLDDAALLSKTIDHVRAILADVLEMDAARIRANRKLEEYGLDSIAIVESTNRLEETLGPLSKTLFFEYVDLEGVAGHLVSEDGDALRALFAEEHPSEPEQAETRQMAAESSRSAADVRSSAPVSDMQEARSPEVEMDARHDIAIVGLSLHVSNAGTQDAFWKMLSEGVHGFEPVPAERWNNGALHHPERDVLGKTVVRTGAFLPHIDKFDPRYFRISQAEAELMSPEVRLVLQASVEAFEDAGYSRETMARRYGGDVAVIVGSMTNEYDLYGFQNMLMRGALASGSYTGTVPNMVSYFYGFTGPSYFLDTMCSASSTCVHEAVHMLRAGRCKMALAGGVSLLLHPQKLIATSQEHFTSKSADVIRGYGLGAEGTILGEGVGALVLKSLADAEGDGDHIYGVIKGSGISNAGVRNGFTVPNPNQQAVAIERALEDADITPQTIGYVEGHGSGTALGDPIEVKALTQVFRKYTDAVESCPIGTVKSNVAHLLGASGLAGIVKVLAQLKHGQLAPSLHAETLNPDIPFKTSPFYVQRELSPWKRLTDETGAELPRRAGVTSIGAGGMNSHIIIEEHRSAEPASLTAQPELLTFSAMTPDRLRSVIAAFRAFLHGQPQVRLADVAYTLQVGKNELTSRLTLVARDREEVLSALDAFLADGSVSTGMVYVPSILDVDPPQDREALKADCAARHLERVGEAWCHGADIDWDSLNEGRDLRRVALPAYPFEKIRCWYQEEPDAPSVVNPIGARSKIHPFIGLNCSDVTGLRYRTAIHLKELRDYIYLDGGRETILPIVAVDIASAAARIAGIVDRPSVSGLRLKTNPVWTEVGELEIEVHPDPAGTRHVISIACVLVSGKRLDWLQACVCDAKFADGASVDLDALRAAASERLDQAAVYAQFKERRLAFGPYLESVQQLWRLPDAALLCHLREDLPQQDFFKKNTSYPAPVLGAVYQCLLLADESQGELLDAIDAASFTGGDVRHLLCLPEGAGSYSVQLLDREGIVLGLLSGLATTSGTAPARAVVEGREIEATQPAHARLRLQDELRAKAAGILKFEASDLGAREAFHDLGFDSISLTRYANEISAAYGIDLSPAIFFECEHIEALAEHLVNRYAVKSSDPQKEAVPVSAIAARSPQDVVTSGKTAVFRTSTEQTDKAGTSVDRIAIIGMAGRFPGSPDVETFFDHLLAGRDLTGDLPLDRYSPVYADRLRSAGFALRGGFLEDIDRFDAAFFKVSPVEAERMDPQQRLLLETAWRTFEGAGYAPEELPRDTGVFIGITSLDYAELWRAEGLATDGYVATGNSLAMAANRLSHRFNLNGPSQAIDTACSSSLVAMLRARDALLSGKCSMALVGGVNLCLSLESFEGPHQAGMLSPTGRCHAFGKAADGYARGEGVATLLMKRLDQAERDGDEILGVIAGGAENHGGRSGALTAPNVKAQARLIVEAMTGIDPETVSYIEAHGTGTELGDPIEVNGLRRAYAEMLGQGTSSGQTISLGTVKSNAGHLEAAAGMAGVVKVLMAMRRGELPPTLESEPLNPHVELEGSPFRILTARTPWPADAHGTPRRAGVSSFGFGGANAHVVLESYDKPSGAVRKPLAPRRFAEDRFWLPGVQPKPAERDCMLFASDWVAAEAKGEPFPGRRIVVACGVIVGETASAETVHPVLSGEGIAGKYERSARQLLDLVRREMALPGHDRVLIQLAVPAKGDGNLYAGLGGLLQTASQEDPRIRTQVVEIPEEADAAQVAGWLAQESIAGGGSHVRYVDGQRNVRVWKELTKKPSAPLWRDHGVYLIAGGMGGLGRILAEHIAGSVRGAVLVLTGSRPLDVERSAFLGVLRELGAVTAYRQVDLGDTEAVKAAVDHIVEVHGHLDGVFHSAGVLRDSFIATKTHGDLSAVLKPKVCGALALRDACAGLDLESFVLFSSLAGPFGNPGQADYAAANGFLDALARSSCGSIMSINWPLWDEGGMRVDDPTREALFRRMGQQPLGTAAGLEALDRCLANKAEQTAVVAGDVDRIRAFFAKGQADRSGAPAIASAGTHASGVSPAVSRVTAAPVLVEKTRSLLSTLLAKVSGLSAAQIDPRTPLEDYGIDSLMITKLNNELGNVFEALPKTLFFRHRTLAAVVDYLVDAQPAACASWAGVETETLEPAPVLAVATETSGRGGSQPSEAEPIAIIGMSGVYPDAPDLDTFWENLLAGHDAVGEIPADRWSLDGFFEPDPDKAAAEGKSYSRWGAFLEGFADFDPLFFKLSPRDAAAMDPQERLFLTSAWQALEDAGYTRARLKKIAGSDHGGARVGVFAGVTKTGYSLHGPFTAQGGATVRPTTSFAGIANRVSHVLDLSGPSQPVDTMCSSSLTAIHEACEHLRRGSCSMALAGGVNLYLHPSNYVELSAAHMLSPSGRCSSFGEGANGFVPGEGSGCIVLKPLSRALADGDRIHALIRGSAVNHGGRTNGYTVPNPDAQRDVVRSALEQAGLSARDIGYIEAHGTGTNLGDPIEVDGLVQAFGADTSDERFCALGSVKSAIGHLEAAAGIAGLTKVVLQMKHRTLVQTLHADRTNPNIDFDGTPFSLQRQAGRWLSSGPRFAGVSSFGAGGANAHVVLEEWQDPAEENTGRSGEAELEIVLLSARSDEQLKESALRLRSFLHKGGSGGARHSFDPAELILNICEKLGALLDVGSDAIDPDESFDTLGLDVSHIPALQKWCLERFGYSPSPAELDMAGSVKGLSDLVQANAADGAASTSPARSLGDIAYTLQVGREPMECRLGLLVTSIQELETALDAWLAGKESPVPVLASQAYDRRGALAALAEDEVIQEVAERAWQTGRSETILRLWVEGVDINWADLRLDKPGRIISLPTYPFEKNRYWLPADKLAVQAGATLQITGDSSSGMRKLVEARHGDTDLLGTARTVDTAVASVLQAILRDLPEADVIPAYRPWLEAANALVSMEAGNRRRSLAETWATWARLERDGASPAQMALAETALKALPEILTGKRRATDVLFPEGRQTLVEAVYKENRIAERFSQTVADAAARHAAAWDASVRKLNILEIGAGTGGTSEPVFEALRPYFDRIGVYTYTDVSRAFLIHAERSYASSVPFLKTALLDIEKPLEGQGIARGNNDLVIAANVLHATADIVSTLARVRETMAPGGVLLLNETSKPTFFTHVTFGLLEGWWRFTDADRRIPGSPSLTAEQWRRALEDSGFDWVVGSGEAEQDLGQQIIVAKARAELSQAATATPAASNISSDRQSLRQDILQALGETLNIAPAMIDLEKSFADYGLDSILGAEFSHRLRKALGIEFSQTDLFDFACVAKLEEYLKTLHPRPAHRGTDAFPDPADAGVAPTTARSGGQEAPAMNDRGREPIAIIGASGRFAGSDTLDALWTHLSAGRDLVEPVSRFDLARFYEDVDPATYGKHGSFLDDVDSFDPVFFGISGVEATYMDPQQRLFLEEAWRTLEAAGHAGEDVVGSRCGVFVGCAHGDYQELFTKQPPGQAFWGNTTSLIPARISYWLDLKGPAVAIDTACSSSLVALHTACQSIRNGECDMALAGGVFVQCSPRFFRYANAAQMLSPSGRCAAFGEGADGIVPGEAVGAVLLRPLAEALADGDTILGVIRASGTNQDGTTNGITAPSAASQERLIRQVYEDHGIDAGSIDYVEAHGTGTVLGDPIEHAALVRAFSDVSERDIFLGSVKSNIGHATTAAGFAGLAKVLLSLREKTIPPTLHFGKGNPAIDFGKGPFKVNKGCVPWPSRSERQRRAAISSFGFSGTNAHVVIEEGPTPDVHRERASSQLFVLSARTPEQLRKLAGNLADHIEEHPEQLAEDVSFTLIAGRRALSHRLFLVTDSLQTASASFRAWLAEDADTGVEVREMTGERGGEAKGSAPPQALDGKQRTAELKSLGRQFLAGARLDPEQLFTRPRRRVPLPVYPFARKRYWVDTEGPQRHPVAETGAEVAKSQHPQSQPPALSETSERQASDRVRLSRPAAMSLPSADAAVSEKVALSPLVPTSLKEGPTGRVERRADTDGVRVLELLGDWCKALSSGLIRELEAASADETVRVVVLAGERAWQAASVTVSDFDPECVLNCALPVIAAVRGGANGQAAGLALLSDFVVVETTGQLTGFPEPASKLAKHLCDRRLAPENSLLRVPASEVEDAAMALAREIAEGPREALSLLKRHMRQDLPLLLADLKPDEKTSGLPEGLPVEPTRASRNVPLKSDVMRLELFDDGVVLVTMNERANRNMFTPAFMDGLEEAFAKISELTDARVVVLTGHDNYFACGGTRDGLADLQKGGSRFTDRRIYSLPLECELPVVAAMQGHGIGAGWSLGMYCDHVILAAEGLYHSNYLWYGFTPGAGATLIFPHRLGDELGREILFSARQYRGRDLGDRSARLTVRPARQVLETALTAAHELARESRESLIAAKEKAVLLMRGRLDMVLERELAMHEKTFIGNDAVRQRIAEKFGEDTGVPELEKDGVVAPVDATALQADLVRSLAEDLMIDVADIRLEDSFLNLGLDSILAVTWIRKLNALFEIDLPATVIYAHPTVKALITHVASLAGVRRDSIPSVQARQATKPPESGKADAKDAAVQEELRAEIVASLAENLMLDPADITDSAGFLDLGLDSILAVTWIRNLNERYEISLPATAVYAHPTVGALVRHVCELVPAAEMPEPVAAPMLPEVEGRPVPRSASAVRVAETIHSGADFAEERLEAIAIVGASGKFPKAEDLTAFWRNIAQGRDCIKEVPGSRWDIGRYYDPDPQAPGKTYCKWMGALDDVAAFDARFFNITPLEAELMDPQQRLFLETAWHAIEDAAINPSGLSGKRFGVYVASGPSGYEDLIDQRNTYSLLGSSGSILAARISYLLDLRGPCLSIDTACSSSLVATAQACEALLSGTCDMALAGGACVLVGPNMFIDTAKVSMLSADGRCYSFDERANGFVPGEGVGAVVLKRLTDAERDGDPIHAVIRGWGINQDGRTNGITAPNPKAQTALMKDVYERFDIDPGTIGLVECHGTGTPLGDPIEVEGLTDAFSAVPADGRCAIGSVKSNIGHVLASAGIAGVLKAMLSLENRQIPPSINLKTLNSHIPFDRTPFAVSRSLSAWETPRDGLPRRAAVSSFGFSGTNAHLVLEEYRSVASAEGGTTPLIFVLSARDRDRLIEYASRIECFIAGEPDLDLEAFAASLQTGRPDFRERLAFVYSGRDDLLRKLAAATVGADLEGVHLSSGDDAATSLFSADDDAGTLVRKWLASGDTQQLDKVAELWAKGLEIDWPTPSCKRLHVPGYPFARSPYWVPVSSDPQPGAELVQEVAKGPLLGLQPSEGEIGRITLRINGDEPYLTTHLTGEARLMTGLYLPEMARGALERLSGKPVSGLTQLIWGRPVAINGKPRDLTFVVMSDAEGLLYRVEADGDEGSPCHLGSGAFGPNTGEARKSIAFDESLPGRDVSEPYRAFAERCSVHSGPPTPEMARVSEVSLETDVLTARVELSQRAVLERRDILFDPYHLDAVWRLLAFHNGGCVADAGDANALSFPRSMESMTGFATAGDRGLVRIVPRSAGSGPVSYTVELYGADGAEALRLEGVRVTALERSRDIRIREELRS